MSRVPASADCGRPYGQRARRVRSPFWLMCRKTEGGLKSRYGGLSSGVEIVVFAIFNIELRSRSVCPAR